jgi:hypothetical protein
MCPLDYFIAVLHHTIVMSEYPTKYVNVIYLNWCQLFFEYL